MLDKLWLYLVLLPIVYGITWLLLNCKTKWLVLVISLVNSIVLTGFVILKFNDPSYFLTEEIELIKEMVHVKKSYTEKGYTFVKDHFVFVDNSYDKQLIEMPDIPGDSSNTAITDRNKLIRFFKFLNKNIETVDLVICDIGFKETTPGDSALKKEMDEVFLKNKLLISYDEEYNTNAVLKFPESICGNIRETTNDKRFISHTIQNDGKKSLAYKIYAFLGKIRHTNQYLGNSVISETDSALRKHYVSNSFIPQFGLIDERRLFGEETIHDPLPYSDSDKELSGFNWLTLGSASTNDGQENLAINFAQRKQNGQKNFIFLGTFRNQEEDIHNTVYKPLHGTTILLNTVYDLYNRKHWINWPEILMLLFGFFLITFMITSLVIHKISFIGQISNWLLKNNEPEKKIKPWWKKIYYKFDFLILPIKFILSEELHYFLLAVLVFSVLCFTGRLVNGMYLTVYFFIFEFSMKYFKEKIRPSRSKKAANEK